MCRPNLQEFLVALTAFLLFLIFRQYYNQNLSFKWNSFKFPVRTHLQNLKSAYYNDSFKLKSSGNLKSDSGTLLAKSLRTSKKRNKAVIKQKIILFTTNWWGGKFPFLKEANKFCPKCLFTQNPSMWKKSDAIIFHGHELSRRVPKRSNFKQVWIMMQFETTIKGLPRDDDVHSRMKKYKGLFNWTMTYRRDSDVFVPYGKFIKIKKTPRPKNINTVWAFMPGARFSKTYDKYKYVISPSLKNFTERKMAAWITSRCRSPSHREDQIAALKKYMKIDIYGDGLCANKKCAVPKWKAKTGIDCRLQIHKQYKFYFAFENSLCKDYVTEKFFDAATMEIIPIVYGGADYKTMFPPKSFINLNDFKDIKDLAGYMKYLGEYPNEWLKYFEWRKDYWIQNNRFVTGYCGVCDKLWSNYSQKSYKSVADWWMYGSSEGRRDNPVCTLPKKMVKRSKSVKKI